MKNNLLQSEWPADGLEYVSQCPVCGAEQSKMLHEGLSDKIFFCAPGQWSMYRCESCDSGYLNPRPSEESIDLAYQNYFTHNKVASYSDLDFIGKIRRQFANGYRNYQYGTKDYPASIMGILAANIMPDAKKIIDVGMRHLPKVKKGDRLLDLGCGNGEFLLRARSAGWDVVGADFDPKAVEAAQLQKLDVRLGGVEALNPAVEQFDVITIAHVIEHVHHPLLVLKACYKLLKNGGVLWLETPNINSEGHKVFGASWRGLEPPRHLVIFSLQSMLSALNAVGFRNVDVQPYHPIADFMLSASQSIEKDIDPYSDMQLKVSHKILKKVELIEKQDPSRREVITVKAWKN